MTQGINKQSVSKVIMMTRSGGTIRKQAYVISHVTTGRCRQKKKKKGEARGARRGAGAAKARQSKISENQAEKEMNRNKDSVVLYWAEGAILF